MVFGQKQAKNRVLILTHYLKGLSLTSLIKINVFGPTELKLWLFKDLYLTLSTCMYIINDVIIPQNV